MRRILIPAMLGTVVVLVAVWLWLTLVYGVTDADQAPPAEMAAIMLAFAVYLVVGLVLVVKRPDNRLGWVLTATGLLTTVGVVAERYVAVALVQHPDAGLPGGVFALWIYSWYWYPLLALMFVFVPLLYPTGRPLTPRWRWLYRAAATNVTLIFIVAAVAPTLALGDPDDPLVKVRNPIGVAALGHIEQSPLGTALFAVLLFLAVCALVSLVIRFRRSRGIERQQMKLFLYAAVLLVTVPLIEETGLERLLPQGNYLFAFTIAAPPAAIGVAVLRYRLYEIDRLISRTVSYVLLTGLLIGLYLGAVTVFTAITAPVAGQSPIAVAAATLLAAAAFRPARRRIQGLVDRRFNRARYDAARTVAAYRSQLRDEVDLTTLTAGLLGTVERSVQPARVALWLQDEVAMEGQS